MKRKFLLAAVLYSAASLLLTGCEKSASAKQDVSGTAPPPAVVVQDLDANNFKVDHPEQFPLAVAAEYLARPSMDATGVVAPDPSRQVPVPSLASGRVVEIDARVGDEVKKGQLLFKVRSTDVSSAYSDYRKAVKNEGLTKTQLDRAKLLFENGAVPKSAVDVAQNAEDDAQVDLETSTEHLKLLGADPDHPTGIVSVFAPESGVITDQQIADSSGVQALTAPNPFTISDLSHVWIICDVYENNLAKVRIGEYADIHLNAYPDRKFRGRISNIGQILDPNLHTAKVRLEVENPGILRLGMFATATFHGNQVQKDAEVPAAAILHLHDRDWVYTPVDTNRFRRVEVVAGDMLPNNMQEIKSGVKPGDKVVSNALVLQSTVEQ